MPPTGLEPITSDYKTDILPIKLRSNLPTARLELAPLRIRF